MHPRARGRSTRLSSVNRSGDGGALLEVADLAKHYPVRSGVIRAKQVGLVRAVDGVSFKIGRAHV